MAVVICVGVAAGLAIKEMADENKSLRSETVEERRMKRGIVVFGLLALVHSIALAADRPSVLEGPLMAVTKGTTCKPSEAVAGKLNCYVRLVDGTSIDIEWVGKDPMILIMQADRKGLYSIELGLRHDCLIIGYGTEGHRLLIGLTNKSVEHHKLAFVSPRTGSVHENSNECKKN